MDETNTWLHIRSASFTVPPLSKDKQTNLSADSQPKFFHQTFGKLLNELDRETSRLVLEQATPLECCLFFT